MNLGRNHAFPLYRCNNEYVIECNSINLLILQTDKTYKFIYVTTGTKKIFSIHEIGGQLKYYFLRIYTTYEKEKKIFHEPCVHLSTSRCKIVNIWDQ